MNGRRAHFGFVGAMAFAIGLQLALAVPAESSTHPLWCGLEAGPHAVGFRAVMLQDHARPFRMPSDSLGNPIADRARPIRFFLWYPASRSASPAPLRYGDYLSLEGFSSQPWSFTEAQVRAGIEKAMAQSIDREKLSVMMDSLRAAPTAAFRDAPPASGRFPLVISGFGGSAPGHVSSILCEYLASHGFIVTSQPALPRREGEAIALGPLTIDLLVRDIAEVIDFLYEFPNADPSKVAFVSMSSSGVAHALIQMQNSDVDAIVSLDGATGYLYGTEMIRESIAFDSTATTVPYLHAHGLMPPNFNVEKDFTYFDSWAKGPAYRLTFEHLAHSTFRANAIVEHQVLKTEQAAALASSYKVLCESVLQFLEAALNGRTGAAEKLMELGSSPGVKIERHP